MKKDMTIPLLSVCAKLEITGLINHILMGVLFTKSTSREVELNSQKIHFSIIGILEHFRHNDENKTVQEILRFIAAHFQSLRDQSNLGDLSGTSTISVPILIFFIVQCFVALLEKQDINSTELQIFTTLCDWLEIRGTDSVHAPLLLSKIRLEDLTLDELKDFVEQKQYFTRRNPCQKLILEAYKFKALNKRDTFINNKVNLCRKISIFFRNSHFFKEIFNFFF